MSELYFVHESAFVDEGAVIGDQAEWAIQERQPDGLSPATHRLMGTGPECIRCRDLPAR